MIMSIFMLEDFLVRVFCFLERMNSTFIRHSTLRLQASGSHFSTATYSHRVGEII